MSPTNYYQLLQVDSGASTTVIRYAYRYMAAMYHPDNTETADVEKFKQITEAWRTLSDPNKRNVYDLKLGIGMNIGAAAGPKATLQSAMNSINNPGAATSSDSSRAKEASTQTTPSVPSKPVTQKVEAKASTSWSEVELRLAVLQVLLDAKRKKPQGGGASASMLMDCLGVELSDLEYILWYLREKEYIKRDEIIFIITITGVDYLVDQLSKTEILNPK
jgi:curved DNA-binding protein CbpA